ncbi:hypothetical protein AOL_s00006g483 [Orbilia oligospora ATCC 24927]|uniref:Alpha/beta hydrolase fold-3 domain-containing protein n=1 Tax=Arthrobotrys oligospora (strain ATCC 24927 / CBS 115.81 / DSM 1491) TaxID=756982 RepID=G1X0T2_ARTOA|nr:hypothetical protein AOL_s00006g483 [Orbilia oligospora ATCC 24927]EGX53222.1 hypothetical protein AOL_s00006g483 [Orbilia oligospora ATCC 24927]
MNDSCPRRAFRPNSNPRESTALHFAYILGFCIFYVPVELVIFSVRRLYGVRSNRIPLLTDLARTLNRKASTTIPGSTLHFLSLDIAGKKVLSSRRYSRYRRNIYHGLNHPAVSGYWVSCGSIAEKCQPRDCDFVVLIIHGGGYVRGHPAILLPGYLRMGEIFSNSGLKVGLFALEYTLAPAGAFHTQIGQARAAYDYLITDCSVHPDKIVVMGESAGGHLAISLMISLVLARQRSYEVPENCKPPACLVLVSPWVNMMQKEQPNLEDDTDMLSQCCLNQWSQLVFPGDYAGGPRTETARTYRNFAAGPPNHLGVSWKQILPKACWVSAGGDELFLPDIQKFVNYAEGAGAMIDLEVAPGKPHAWPAIEGFIRQSSFLALSMDEGSEKVASRLLSGFDLIAARIIERMQA